MFTKLFAESGLSLDRLRAFLAVAAAGSIVKATAGDPVKQSQYSRQIKELEDFFRIKLMERQGRGVKLTTSGRELARISRFFLLGLSNFQRGSLSEEQTFRIGASATLIRSFLLPVLSDARVLAGETRYVIETVSDDEIERRLHDLRLDFGVTTQPTISRPLQLKQLSKWHLGLWVPKEMHKTDKIAGTALKEERLPLVLATKELEMCGMTNLVDWEPRLACESFVEARMAMKGSRLAAILPDFLVPPAEARTMWRLRIPSLESGALSFRFAWNPRLLRLNPHAVRQKDFLYEALAKQMNSQAD